MTNKKLEAMLEMRRKAELGGGERRIEAQHEKGKYTARERLKMLLDPGSFEEMDMFVTHRCEDFGMQEKHFMGDGVVIGHGRIDGRQVYVFSQDFTVLGGTLAEAHCRKINKVQDMAVKTGSPCIGIYDSGGARIQEGVDSLGGIGEMFFRHTMSSGVVPQISIIMGPSAGGAVYCPGLTDFVFMVDKTSNMFITGPQVIKTVTNEEVTPEELGGATVHNTQSGVSHFFCTDEKDAFSQVRRLLSFLPSNNLEEPPPVEPTDDPDRMDQELAEIVPDDPNKSYDMRDVITKVVDHGDFFQVHENYAPNIITCFARLMGQTVGIIANQPAHMAGALDVHASMKASRFIRFCDAFNIPIITFVDVPGYLPGVDQEYQGIIKHGAKLVFAYCEANVPKLTVITRKAYGGAYIVMCSKHIRSDLNFAWPSSEIAVMGPEGAVNIIFRNAMKEAKDPKAKKKKLVEEFREKFASPHIAASRGYIDAVIDPRKTRMVLIEALTSLANKREARPAKKHGNIPL
jgi:propionyl-CoA carboxylase beta chain